MVGLFLLTAISVISYPNFYNYLFLGVLPMILGSGSVFGSITGVFVWLPGVLLKRRLRWATRVVIGMGAVTVLVVVLSYLPQQPESYQPSVSWFIE
ncbi:MAG: hypothetical protein ACR2HX_25295 [Pyrinomonadaceae bacterium]